MESSGIIVCVLLPAVRRDAADQWRPGLWSFCPLRRSCSPVRHINSWPPGQTKSIEQEAQSSWSMEVGAGLLITVNPNAWLHFEAKPRVQYESNASLSGSPPRHTKGWFQVFFFFLVCFDPLLLLELIFPPFFYL